jgi:iron complex outermembrane recepter protein
MKESSRMLKEARRAFAAAVFAFISCAPIRAQELSSTPVAFSVEPQPLYKALNVWARQAGLQLIWPAEDGVGQKISPRLVGEFTPEEALRILLAGTGLEYNLIDSRTVTIGPPKVAKEGSGSNSARRPEERNPAVQGDARATATAPANELVEVIVTGTHIRGIQNKTAKTIVIDREEIERSGYSTIQEVFRALPQNFGGGQFGGGDDGRFGSGFFAATNFASSNTVNLRGLGESSTLVLLNGHRIAPALYGAAIDVATIPMAAVDRIEILPGGSSALYGSEAVGGVANVILRSDVQGAETTIRYGSVTSGRRSEQAVAQTLGGSWDTGNVVATFQYQGQDALRAQDRESTSNLTVPNDVLPDADSYGVALTGNLDFSDRIGFYADGLWSRRDTHRLTSNLQPILVVNDVRARSETVSFAPGLRIKASDNWSLRFVPSYSEQHSTQRNRLTPIPAGTGTVLIDLAFTQAAVDLTASGRLLHTRAGDVNSAVGISYRDERFVQNTNTLGVLSNKKTDRDVTAAFVEFYVPLVGDSDDMKLLRAIDLSFAARYDRYSDAGSETTPHVGLHWSPVKDFSIRGSYGRSFRAPNAGEVTRTRDPVTLTAFPFPSSAGGVVPGLVYSGSTQNLQPERARTLELSVEYSPETLTGLTVGVDGYSVRYSNRIISPRIPTNPFESPEIYGSLITRLANDQAARTFIDAAVANGAQYTDPLGIGIIGARNVFDSRQQNAAVVHQSGLDFSARYVHTLTSGTLSARALASYIDKIDTKLTAGSASQELAGTLGNPPKWRARADIDWSVGGWMINAAMNYTHHYANTAGAGQSQIGSWATVDLTAQLDLGSHLASSIWRDSELTLTVQNVFDRSPPHVSALPLIRVAYDPANATPLGRFVALQLKKSW